MKGSALDPHIDTIKAMMAAGKSSGDVARHLGVPVQSLLNYARRRELGDWQKTKRDSAKDTSHIPADFADNWRGMSLKQLQAHYGRGAGTVHAWTKLLGLKRPQGARMDLKPRLSIALPDDYQQHSRETVAQLCVRYGVSRETIGKFDRAVGVTRTRFIGNKPPAMLIRAVGALDVSRNHRNMSQAGQAADFLRKFGAVWRCKPTGSPDPQGSHWRRGSAVLTDADLIARAERLGWDIDAWKRVA